MGNSQAILVGNHMHRLGGTVFIAGAASRVVGVDDAVIPDEMSHAELHSLLGNQFQRTQRAGGADFPATVAFIAAITGSEFQMRL